jgi:hypothetical protein
MCLSDFSIPGALSDLQTELKRHGYPAYPQPEWFKALRTDEVPQFVKWRLRFVRFDECQTMDLRTRHQA